MTFSKKSFPSLTPSSIDESILPKNGITTIINYCTNDYRFLRQCIHQARYFSDEIIVPVCDHFFDGTPENQELLQQSYQENPDTTFVEFAYSPTKLYSPFLRYTSEDPEWVHIWHSTSRYIGWLHANPNNTFLLFLDADEIPDGEKMAQWLKTKEHMEWSALYLTAHLYILRATLRAKRLQETALLAKHSALTPHALLLPTERQGLYDAIAGPKKKGVRGVDQSPLFHHYSWVRTREECNKKAKTWGHRDEGNWEAQIEATFLDESKAFGSNHPFEEIKTPFFDPLQKVSVSSTHPLHPIKKLSIQESFQIETNKIFFI